MFLTCLGVDISDSFLFVDVLEDWPTSTFVDFFYFRFCFINKIRFRFGRGFNNFPLSLLLIPFLYFHRSFSPFEPSIEQHYMSLFQQIFRLSLSQNIERRSMKFIGWSPLDKFGTFMGRSSLFLWHCGDWNDGNEQFWS